MDGGRPHRSRGAGTCRGLVVCAAISLGHAAPPAGVTVELRTFIAHGDVDAWGRTTGLSCVVTNASDRPLRVHVGYDGALNRLRSPVGGSAIALRPEAGAGPGEPHDLAAGESHVLFTLSLHAILLRDVEDPSRAPWRWGWAEPAPRQAPPPSPVHPGMEPGWQAVLADDALLVADVDVDGALVSSAPLRIAPVRPGASGGEPAPPLEVALTTPSGEVLIPGAEIVAYHWPSHAVRFAPGTLPRVRAQLLPRLAGGVPFELRIGGERVYAGVLTTSLSSRSQRGVVMVLDGDVAAVLACGYPSPSSCGDDDPRDDERLRSALLRAHVLLQ